MPYSFSQEDYLKFQDDILKANGDQATITTLLADMQTTITDSLALVESTKSDNQVLSDENTRLKESNLSLLRRVGENALMAQGSPQSIIQDDEPKYKDVGDYMSAYFKSLNGVK